MTQQYLYYWVEFDYCDYTKEDGTRHVVNIVPFHDIPRTLDQVVACLEKCLFQDGVAHQCVTRIHNLSRL